MIDYKDDKQRDNKNEKNEKKLENQMVCEYGKPRPPGKVCLFSADDLGSCSPTKSKGKYGFHERKPCIFLKLNKVYIKKTFLNLFWAQKTNSFIFIILQIYNWVPNLYNDTDDLPEKMPEYLKTAIKDITNEKEVII